MQRGENMGSIALGLSMVAILVGAAIKNIVVLFVGVFTFIKIVDNMCKIVNRKLEMRDRQNNADNYAKMKAADTKRDILLKAYEDGKINNEDISFLVRSLSSQYPERTTSIAQPVIQRPVAVEDRTQVIEAEVVSESSSKDNSNEGSQVIQYIVDNGRFLFEYNGNKLGFSPADVIKGEALHKDFDDSFGYYKNADAIFYIYPVDKKIVAVNI